MEKQQVMQKKTTTIQVALSYFHETRFKIWIACWEFDMLTFSSTASGLTPAKLSVLEKWSKTFHSTPASHYNIPFWKSSQILQCMHKLVKLDVTLRIECTQNCLPFIYCKVQLKNPESYDWRTGFSKSDGDGQYHSIHNVKKKNTWVTVTALSSERHKENSQLRFLVERNKDVHYLSLT